MDNETSKAINQTKRDIQKYNNHSIAISSAVDPEYPVDFHRKYDFNKIPMGLLVNPVNVHNRASERGSWNDHGTEVPAKMMWFPIGIERPVMSLQDFKTSTSISNPYQPVYYEGQQGMAINNELNKWVASRDRVKYLNTEETSNSRIKPNNTKKGVNVLNWIRGNDAEEMKASRQTDHICQIHSSMETIIMDRNSVINLKGPSRKPDPIVHRHKAHLAKVDKSKAIPARLPQQKSLRLCEATTHLVLNYASRNPGTEAAYRVSEMLLMVNIDVTYLGKG
eukprot:jgi/Psemu1/31117/gm1.31117_g